MLRWLQTILVGRCSGGERQVEVDEHTDIVQPAMLPEQINKRAGSIELYRVAVLALAGIGAVGLLGILVISAIGRTVPDGAIVLASVAVGALASMVGGQAVSA